MVQDHVFLFGRMGPVAILIGLKNDNGAGFFLGGHEMVSLSSPDSVDKFPADPAGVGGRHQG